MEVKCKYRGGAGKGFCGLLHRPAAVACEDGLDGVEEVLGGAYRNCSENQSPCRPGALTGRDFQQPGSVEPVCLNAEVKS